MTQIITDAPLVADYAVILWRHGDSPSGHGRLPDIIRVASIEEGEAILRARLTEPHPYHAGHLVHADRPLGAPLSESIRILAYAG